MAVPETPYLSFDYPAEADILLQDFVTEWAVENSKSGSAISHEVITPEPFIFKE